MHQQQTYAWYEDAPQYRCPCCCCKCCHIKIACGILAGLCLVGSIIDAINGIRGVSDFHNSSTTAFVVILNIIFPICLAITSALVFVAILKVKPTLVWPHIAALIVGIIFAAITMLVCILIIANVTTFGEEWLRSFQRSNQITIDNLNKLHDTNQAALTTVGVIFTIVFLLIAALQGYFIYLFFILKRYLTDKQAVMQGKTVTQMQPY